MVMLLDANGALYSAALGLLLIFAEFCLPGRVIPGVLGGVLFVCGAYRLSLLDARVGIALGLVLALGCAAAAGYGYLPEALGWASVLAVPWLSRLLVPGHVRWLTAAFTAVPPVAALLLLRIAARGAASKTFLH